MADEEIGNEIRTLNSVLERLNEKMDTLSDKIAELKSEPKEPKSGKLEENTEAEKKEKEKAEFKRRLAQATYDQIVSVLTQLPTIFAQQVDAARNLADQSGTTLSQAAGSQQEARNTIFGQVKQFGASLFGGEKLDFNKAIRLDEFNKSFAGVGQALGGFTEGTTLSAKAVTEFQAGAKAALGTQAFSMTPEVFRAMAMVGMRTTQDLQKFREATGLSSLRGDMLAAMINKNAMAFQLFGNSYAKTALQAERLGISLQSVQQQAAGQLSNVEGTLDLVNQLNMLGANIDFTELLQILEFDIRQPGGPEKLARFLDAAIPNSLRTITTPAALAEQLMPADVLAKFRADTGTKELEKAFTEPTPDPRLNNLSFLQEIAEILRQLRESAPVTSAIGGGIMSILGTGLSALTTGLITKFFVTDALKKLPVFQGPVPPPGLKPPLPVPPASLGMRTAVSAAGRTPIGATIIVGLGSGMLIGDQINKAMGTATMGDFIKYTLTNKGKREEEAEAIATQNKIRQIREDAARVRGITVEQYVEMQRSGAPMPTAGQPGATPTAPAAQTATMAQQTTSLTTAQTEMITNTNRLISKTEELVNVLKTLNLPELTNAIKTSEKTLEINIDGQRVTIPGVGLTGTRLRNDTLTRR